MRSALGDRLGGRSGPVFGISIAVSALFLAWGIFFTSSLATTMSAALDWVTRSFGWMYLASTVALLGFLVVLACSRYGKIRLGKDHERPEFSTFSWLAMMLAAIMGIGLIAYGVAEPISHFATPPHGLAQPESARAMVVALQYSFFHWGLHAWGVFAVFGLAIGYSMYRKGRKGLVSSLFYPLLGDRVHGPIGKAIDVLAIFATLFGTTTSLGLGALQINGGLNTLFGVPTGEVVQIAIIAVITLLFTASAVTGLHRGIKYLSTITAGIATPLLVFVLIAGPTVFLANLFFESAGAYLTDFVRMSLRGATFGDLAWMQSWTYFMLAWWVAWAAFVGVFLARISRGRTIREFIVGVLVGPSAAFFAWFTVFGGAAMHRDFYQGGNIAQVTANNINDAFFATLDAFPWPVLTSAGALILAVLFFVTSADSNTFVLSMLSSEGTQQPKRRVLVTWGSITGLTAIVLLLTGGLDALQQTVIVTSAPFIVIIFGLAIAFWKDLKGDPVVHAQAIGNDQPEPAVAEEPDTAVYASSERSQAP
ncbi:MAG: BCCT family transporter [Actinophytocola sp.]|nr:BCCT family transporter [Actinophytocola sp.]